MFCTTEAAHCLHKLEVQIDNNSDLQQKYIFRNCTNLTSMGNTKKPATLTSALISSTLAFATGIEADVESTWDDMKSCVINP